ncbi:MAG: sigma factor SigF [Synechococcaceae cyanobacterium ELA263]
MFPPIGCCSGLDDGDGYRRRHQQRKLQMLTFWRDGAERQLAALNAAISTLEQQIQRNRPESQA